MMISEYLSFLILYKNHFPGKLGVFCHDDGVEKHFYTKFSPALLHPASERRPNRTFDLPRSQCAEFVAICLSLPTCRKFCCKLSLIVFVLSSFYHKGRFPGKFAAFCLFTGHCPDALCPEAGALGPRPESFFKVFLNRGWDGLCLVEEL